MNSSCPRRFIYFKNTINRLHVLVPYNGSVYCYAFSFDNGWHGGARYSDGILDNWFDKEKNQYFTKIKKPEDVPHCPYRKGERT